MGPCRSQNTKIPGEPRAGEAHDQKYRCEQTVLPWMLCLTRGQRKPQDIGPWAASEMIPLAIFMLALSRLPHPGAGPDDTEGGHYQFDGRLKQTPEKKAKHYTRYAFRLFGSPQFRLMSERNRNCQEVKSGKSFLRSHESIHNRSQAR